MEITTTKKIIATIVAILVALPLLVFATTSKTIIWEDGKYGIASSTPTGLLSIGAGTATVPQLVLEPGASLTSSIPGAFTYGTDGHLTFYDGIETVFVRSAGVAITTTTVSNTTASTTIYATTFPPNTFLSDQKVVFEMSGAYSNATASDDFTLYYYIAGIEVASTARTAGNVTNQGWESSLIGTIRTSGASGTFVHSHTYDDTVTRAIHSDLIEKTIDTTAEVEFEVAIVWDNAKAGNTFSMSQADIVFRH